jgi:hypothetical protein
VDIEFEKPAAKARKKKLLPGATHVFIAAVGKDVSANDIIVIVKRRHMGLLSVKKLQ